MVACPSPHQSDAYAETIREHSRWRTFDAGLRRVRQVLDSATTVDSIADTLAVVLDTYDREVIRQGAKGTAAGIDYTSMLGLFSRPREATTWLVPPLLALGRMTLLYSPGKAGKSLVAMEIAAALATGKAIFREPARREPKHVLYVDQEMTLDDWQDRLSDMGYADPDEATLDAHLHLAQLQAWPPLDTPAGGAMIHREATRLGAKVVIIDTVSKVIEGEENSNDTQQAFYRNTIVPLKRDGIALLVLDHTGKDVERGARGGSAKTDNIDLSVELYSRGKSKLGLRIRAARFNDPALEHPTFLRRETSPLRHEVEDYQPGEDNAAGFRPSYLMEKVSRYVAANPGTSGRGILDARLGSKRDVRFALELLVNEGFVLAASGARNSIAHTTLKAFRQEWDTGPPDKAEDKPPEEPPIPLFDDPDSPDEEPPPEEEP